MKCPACNNETEGIKSPYTGNNYCLICGYVIYENNKKGGKCMKKALTCVIFLALLAGCHKHEDEEVSEGYRQGGLLWVTIQKRVSPDPNNPNYDPNKGNI